MSNKVYIIDEDLIGSIQSQLGSIAGVSGEYTFNALEIISDQLGNSPRLDLKEEVTQLFIQLTNQTLSLDSAVERFYRLLENGS